MFIPTPHVKLFNFGPPDRGGGYLTPCPSPNAIQNYIKNQTRGTVESCLPPVIYKIEHRGRYRTVPPCYIKLNTGDGREPSPR